MKKKLFGILLSLAMMLVLVLGVQLTAFAEDIYRTSHRGHG